LIAFFNKNMTVILVLTIAFATLLNAILTGSGIKIEGFDDSAKDKKESESKSDSDSSNKEPLKEKDGESTSSIAKPEPTNAAATSPKVLMENLKVQALDLQDAQKEIISGFQQIEPHMQRAESLIGSIQETAQTIQGMRTKS
jgi:flagellum-specific peptidoglycan hydrolase FlgJ